MQSDANENEAEKENLHLLLDRAIELYSALPLILKTNSESIEKEVNELRRREITQLVEDISFAINEVGSEPKRENESNDVLKKFDDAIISAAKVNDFDNQYLTKLASDLLEASVQEDTSSGCSDSESSSSSSSSNKIIKMKTRLEELEILVKPVKQMHASNNFSKNDNSEQTDRHEKGNKLQLGTNRASSQDLKDSDVGSISTLISNSIPNSKPLSENEMENANTESHRSSLLESNLEAEIQPKIEENVSNASETASVTTQNEDSNRNGSEILVALITVCALAGAFLNSNVNVNDMDEFQPIISNLYQQITT